MGEIYVFIKHEIEAAVDELIKKAIVGKSYTLGLKPDEIDDRNQLKPADWLGAKLVPKFQRAGKKLSFLLRHRKYIEVKKSVKAAGVHKFTVETSRNVHVGKLKLTPPNVETGLEDGASPARVVQTGLIKPPVGCDFELFDSALRLLRKPKSFSYVASSNSWTVDLPKRKGRPTSTGWEFKLDPEGQWRVVLGLKHDAGKNELTVNVLSCQGPKDALKGDDESKSKNESTSKGKGEEQEQKHGRDRSKTVTEQPSDDAKSEAGPNLKEGQSPQRVNLIGLLQPLGCPPNAHKLALRALRSPDSFQWDASGKRWTVVAANQVVALTSRSFTLPLSDVGGESWVLDLLWKYDAEKELIVVKIDACHDGAKAKPKPKKRGDDEGSTSTESESEESQGDESDDDSSTKPKQKSDEKTRPPLSRTAAARKKYPRPENGSNPAQVLLKGLRKCPVGCNPLDFEQVLKELADRKSYSYLRSADRFNVGLKRHVGNPSGADWELDIPGVEGSGTLWTMLLTFKRNRERNGLIVTVRSCTAG